MTIARDGKNGLLDYTPLTALVERTDNALETLGLFEEFYGQTTTAEVEPFDIEIINESFGLPLPPALKNHRLKLI